MNKKLIFTVLFTVTSAFSQNILSNNMCGYFLDKNNKIIKQGNCPLSIFDIKYNFNKVINLNLKFNPDYISEENSNFNKYYGEKSLNIYKKPYFYIKISDNKNIIKNNKIIEKKNYNLIKEIRNLPYNQKIKIDEKIYLFKHIHEYFALNINEEDMKTYIVISEYDNNEWEEQEKFLNKLEDNNIIEKKDF